RFGPGDQFRKIEGIQQFGERISHAAGKSTNIELYPIEQRPGGNGPILAQTLAHYGIRVELMGALGQPIDPLFENLSPSIVPISLGQPAVTNAIEFNDGKLMLGITHSLDAIDLAITAPIFEKNHRKIASCDLLCFVNWTMMIHMDAMVDFLWQRLEKDRRKIVFFDLADPEKRSTEDIRNILASIQRYTQKRFTILGLNLKEAEQIAVLLPPAPRREILQPSLVDLCRFIGDAMGIDEVFIHDNSCCAASTPTQTAFVDGFFVPNPRTTTGAGDHFNGGYLVAKLRGKSLEACLTKGYKISSYFVRTGTFLPPQNI
ncbi:MAG: carbohydrate kinase family protein, partial [Puniceicoccales bacterium]|nr:carbohydrate kinase family protein [Puniceicoccales bacterium]